jgi:diadenosine tetraphosphate (Ap4A) HIT family hydrolase
MTELTYGERDHLMTLVFAVEEAVRHVMRPDKINIAALGNMVPHMHWHVIPRFRDDIFFPGSVWSGRLRETSEAVIAERRHRATELPQAIREEISQLN